MLTFSELITAYLHQLENKPSWSRTNRVARPWIRTLTVAPTRDEILRRRAAFCVGDFQPGASAANKEVKLIRAACNWGVDEGHWPADQDPTARIKLFRVPKRRRFGKLAELRTILHGLDFLPADHAETRALFGVLLFTGCRPSEARRMRVESVTDFGTVGCWEKGRTKNGERQELPLPSCVMAWLREVKPSGPYYFSHNGETPLDESTVRKRWAQFREALRIRDLWTYDLRRTLATYLHTVRKESDSTIQAILNHYDGRALSHYVQHPFDFLAEVIQGYADWLLTVKEGPHAMPSTESLSLADRLHSAASGGRGLTDAAVCDDAPAGHAAPAR